jgi:hypothetical protein
MPSLAKLPTGRDNAPIDSSAFSTEWIDDLPITGSYIYIGVYWDVSRYVRIAQDMIRYDKVYIYIYISRYGMILSDMLYYDKIYLNIYSVGTLYPGYPNATQNVTQNKRLTGMHLSRVVRNDMWTQPHKESCIRSHLADPANEGLICSPPG